MSYVCLLQIMVGGDILVLAGTATLVGCTITNTQMFA
jgi:hypothetical protein